MASEEMVDRPTATEAGWDHYFDTTPCKRGHTSKRRTNDAACLACALENINAYNKRHPGREMHLINARRGFNSTDNRS